MNDPFYTNLYEKLYADLGYHRDLDYDEHSAQATTFLFELHRDKSSGISILDVGCSNGKAVERLTEMGFTSSGIDVSPTAVEMCAARGLGDCCVGSATEIPHADSSFDIILSTDVLEHLRPEDLPAMLSEFSRVARQAIIVKIALVPEYHKFTDEPLHLSIFPAMEWLRMFYPTFGLETVVENCPDFFTVYLRRRDDVEPWETVVAQYRAELHEKEAINLQGRVKRSRRALTKEKERVAEMREILESSKKTISRLADEVSGLMGNLSKANHLLALQQERNTRLKAALDQAKAKRILLQNSKAYKFGRIILFPFRWIGKTTGNLRS